jgi:arylsulfatase A-like enzyme
MRLVLSFVVLVALATSTAAQEKRKPNVIILLADDLGFADLGLHGNKDIATPHIDSLAANGARCTNGYVTCPVCSPTRAGLLTGRYQQRFGHEFNPAMLRFGGAGQGLPLDQKTIADYLRAAGYATALFGKWHLGEEDAYHPLQRGFHEFFGFLTGAHSYLDADDPNAGPLLRGKDKTNLDRYLTDQLAAEAARFIERQKANPFFIYLSFNAVHTPMHAPEETKRLFAKEKDEQRQTYLAMLKKLDDAVGTVLAKLRELNLEEDTLIFFLSDNGGPTTKFSSNGSRNSPLRGSKGDTWDGGIHVPFLVQWKGKIPAGTTFPHPVISLDLAATALAAAGTHSGSVKLDGVDLVPHLTGKNQSVPHDSLYWRFGAQMAIRQGDWVLVRPSLGTKEYENVSKHAMLYNLAQDIGQEKDVSAQNPERVRAMQADWDRWSASLAQPRWPATLKGKAFAPAN